MKVRKTKELAKALKKKGFVLDPEKDHHQFYYLTINGIKYPIYTYLSHGISEYGNSLMSEIKKQLKFRKNRELEDFFDCPMSKAQYIKLLADAKEIELPN